MPLRLDGYIRVSRVGGREGEGYISPDVQRQAVAAYAAELGGEIVSWHTDEDFSGANTERPGFQAALRRMREGRTDGVVVMKIDRFARSVADGATIVREIIERDQVFAACHERIDPRTPEGMFMLNSFLNNAELFVNQTKAGWWTSKSRAVARGAHIGPTPIGYLRVKSPPLKPEHISPVDAAALVGGSPASGELIPDPVYGPAIGKLFTRAAMQRDGDSELARYMTTLAPRRSGRDWQPSEIRRWLKNRVYLGEVHYGDLVNAAAHDGLTEPVIWDRCQREPRAQRHAHSSFLLSGIVRCASCRYSMGGQTYGGAKGDTPVYRCTGRGDCAEPSVIVAKRLDRFVLGEVKRFAAGLEVEGAAGPDLAGLERELAGAEEELQRFASDLDARRALGEGGWQEALAVRASDRDTKREARRAAFAANRMAALAMQIGDLDDHGLRDTLLGMVRHIFIRRLRGAPAAERTLIVWADDPRSIDVPGPHRSGPFEAIGW